MKRLASRTLPFLAALVLAATAACMTPSQQKLADLKMTTRQHNSDVRWGRYNTAASNFVAPGGDLFMKRVSLVEAELVMADQEVESITLNEDNKATAMVVMMWYTQREPIVRTTYVEQVWVFRGSQWFIETERRVRGDRFPLVPEKTKVEGAAVEAMPAAEGADETPPAAAEAPPAN